MFFLYLLAPLIANERPLLLIDQTGMHLPFLSDSPVADSTASFVLHAPIRWSPGVSDLNNAGYVGPFDAQLLRSSDGKQTALPLSQHHWMGTDLRGCDVLSGILHGASRSLRIGILAVFFALLLGLFLGGVAGWTEQNGMLLRYSNVGVAVIALLGLGQAVWLRQWGQGRSATLLLVLVLATLGLYLWYRMRKSEKSTSRKTIVVPFDRFVQLIMLLLSAFPKLMLVLILAALLPPSETMVISILALCTLPDLIRLIRQEVMRIRPMEYMDAAELSGASTLRKITKQVLPNMLPSLMVAVTYALSSIVLMEASLGFLGIGVPANEVSWGTLLASGKEHLQAWWLVIFPGFFLAFTVIVLQRCAEELARRQ